MCYASHCATNPMASVYSKLFSDSNTILETSKQVDGGISGTVEAWLHDGKAVMSVRNCSSNINHYIAVALTSLCTREGSTLELSGVNHIHVALIGRHSASSPQPTSPKNVLGSVEAIH